MPDLYATMSDRQIVDVLEKARLDTQPRTRHPMFTVRPEGANTVEIDWELLRQVGWCDGVVRRFRDVGAKLTDEVRKRWTEPPTCVTCAHVCKSFGTYYCNRQSFRYRSPVTGAVHKDMRLCGQERITLASGEDVCGMSGKFWEPRPVRTVWEALKEKGRELFTPGPKARP